MPAGEVVGSAAWVRDQLGALSSDERWIESDACRELITWLYAVATHRAARARVTASDCAEVAQDAMPVIFSALKQSRGRFVRAGNPAAVLEHVTERAVQCAVHRVRMGGLGGASANGRNWHVVHPPCSIGGDAALDLLDHVPAQADMPCRKIEDAAEAVARWVTEHLGITLTDNAADAVVYVLDRLVAGRTRGGLVRSPHVGLASDPAMAHLGFDAVGARTFARWLLGRNDPGRERPSVLDAALLGGAVPNDVMLAWCRIALEAGFAHVQVGATVIPLPTGPHHPGRKIA